jgi:hypothetical protein
MPSPEELAREKIDKLLTECGWIIQNRSAINLSAGRGIAIREALLRLVWIESWKKIGAYIQRMLSM